MSEQSAVDMHLAHVAKGLVVGLTAEYNENCYRKVIQLLNYCEQTQYKPDRKRLYDAVIAELQTELGELTINLRQQVHTFVSNFINDLERKRIGAS